MAISHSNHLFVPVAFVFCLLLPLIHASDSRSDNYSDSRLEKNPAVSRHRNNIQRLPNYNWKPPDKYYGPREESTEKNLGMEFTKPEDPEQRMADSWIKKMQEISRQEREKWAAHRRNMKLTLDNVEETTKAGKLTNDESITVDPITLKSLVWYPSTNQDNRRMEDGSSRSSSKQLADTNVDGAFDKKLKNDERNTDIKNSYKKFLRKPSATHRRHKDYEISDIKEEPFFKQNAATDYEKSKLEKDRPSSITNSPPEKSISQQFKDAHILKSSTSTNAQKNFTKFSEIDEDVNLNHLNDSEASLEKKYLKRFNSSRNKKKESNNKKKVKQQTENLLMRKNDNVNSHPESVKEKSRKSISQQSETPHVPESSTNKNHEKFSGTKENLNHKIDSKFPAKEYSSQSSLSPNEEHNQDSKRDDGKTVTARSLVWKSKKEKDSAAGNDVTEKLNHERSGFRSGRWGMSVSSPPAKFLKDMSRRLKRRKNEEQTEEDGKRHLFGRWGMSIASPPKEFLEDISRLHREHGTECFTRSGPNEVKGSSDDRPPIHQSHRNLQTAQVQQPMNNEPYKKLTLLGKVPNGLYSRHLDSIYWNNNPTNIDLFNESFLRFLQALRSYIWQDDIDISYHIRIPNASLRG